MVSRLFMRLVELRDEYFNEINNYDLSRFHDLLTHRKKYSSEELIDKLAKFSDLFNLRGE